MKNVYLIVIFVCVFSLSHSHVQAQIESDSIKKEQSVIIEMNDGEKFEGYVHRRDSTFIVLKTVNAEIILSTINIKSIEINDYSGKFKFANFHDTRYFFGPSAIPIKKGKGYYQNLLVVFNFVNVGITDNISIGGGFEFLTLVNGQPIIFLTPKVGFKLAEKFHAGGGLLFGTMVGEGSITLPYLVSTYGSSENNVSLGVGVGLSSNILGSPAIMLSGTSRISNYVALLTENYLLPGDESIYIGIHGLRIISRKNSFDFGVAFITDAETPIPYVGYVRTF